MSWDYHIHSDYSDSDQTLKQILNQARQRNLEAIALTDHDCVEGALQAAKLSPDLEIVLGVEVSAQDDQGSPIHVLGYDFDPEAVHLRRLCHKTLLQQQERSIWQIEQLRRAGYPITVEEVIERLGHSMWIYKQHIMDVLTEKGIAESLNGDFYRKTFKNGGICERAILFPSVQEAMEAIHADHGLAVLAHPGLSGCIEQIWKWKDLGLDGIETGHSSHSFRQVMQLHEIAMALGLIETAGSDNHGRYGKEPLIGTISWKGDRLCRRKKN